MNNVSTTVTIHTLPYEVLESILSYTNYPSAISLVCKEWYEISQNPQTALALLKDRKIRLGIEEVFEKSKYTDNKDRVTEIQTLFLTRLRLTLNESLITDEQFNLFKSLPPSTGTFLHFNELEQDLNLLKLFAVLEKQVKDSLIKPQNSAEEKGSVHQQANHIREILKQNPAALKTITEIDLSQTGMTVVPEELNLLTEVTSVSLDNNNIHMLPTNFGSAWAKLTSLHLGFNRIERLPANFGQEWVELKSLNLSHNALTSLPDQFGMTWSKIFKIGLEKNKIASIPSKFGAAWNNVNVINLSSNLLDHLPEKFGANWIKLQCFEVHKNHSVIDVAQLKKQWPRIIICK
ncbi:hypothetical protein PNK_p0113 (plasmid) [Candidatus Protochlamydia naegleriophila]|uniref:F-box domain-containing protein n=1 Tax=Candidatus Protochlamydia naegleriophila TaxID=389348 RepID=A0A0U5JG41_9BACT|nr:F-box-like domain-containing protein [Candidatus Protochlamydia naegleriophila]CUI18167.1 hypothetical protein PNK_p0113 [Candidatus Protochlamydia naegleriophila]